MVRSYYIFVQMGCAQYCTYSGLQPMCIAIVVADVAVVVELKASDSVTYLHKHTHTIDTHLSGERRGEYINDQNSLHLRGYYCYTRHGKRHTRMGMEGIWRAYNDEAMKG